MITILIFDGIYMVNCQVNLNGIISHPIYRHTHSALRSIYTGNRAHTYTSARSLSLHRPLLSLSISLSLRSPLLHHSCFARVWYVMRYTGCNHSNGSCRAWTMILFRFFHSHYGNIAPASTQSMSTRGISLPLTAEGYFRMSRDWWDTESTFNAVGTCPMFPFKVRGLVRFLLHISRVPPSASSCARVPLMLLLLLLMLSVMQVEDCCHFITPSQAVSLCSWGIDTPLPFTTF